MQILLNIWISLSTEIHSPTFQLFLFGIRLPVFTIIGQMFSFIVEGANLLSTISGNKSHNLVVQC